MILFGTRPEAIKVATVIRAFHQRYGPKSIHVCCSGQHRELMADTTQSINIPIDVNFDLISQGLDPEILSSRIMVRTQMEIELVSPRWIMVHGDTATTLGGANAGYFSHVDVIHLEAGLRTNDLESPWPEEGIRQAVSRITDLHLSSTPEARNNLLSEGTDRDVIRIVGNPGADLIINRNRDVVVRRKRPNNILVTIHRRENQGDSLEQIIAALEKILETEQGYVISFIGHPSPDLKARISQLSGYFSPDIQRRFFVHEPLPYQEFIFLLEQASMVITDSGGLQEEAALLGIPCVIARKNTERPEIVELGLARIGGTTTARLVEVSLQMLAHLPTGENISTWRTLQGNGNAGDKVVTEIMNYYGQY